MCLFLQAKLFTTSSVFISTDPFYYKIEQVVDIV